MIQLSARGVGQFERFFLMDDPFERPALVRRETLKRLENSRQGKYTEWFQPQE
jgi:hypothetical protein